MGAEEKKMGESESASAAATNEKKKKLQKSYFDVLGLCCSSEIPLVENILKQLDGVKDVSVIVASRTVIVVHDNHLVSPTQIVNALNQARLEANIKVSGESNQQQQHRWPSPYAIASGTLLLLSFLKYVYHPLRWFAIAAVVAGIFPVAWKGLAAARNFRIDINILVIVAVVGTIAMNDYLEAGTIVFLFTIAEWLESRASHKATAEMSSLMSIAPRKAVIAETGEVVDVDEVNLNTVVAVKAGEVIPIDGIVVDGRSEVDEKTLTGESFPMSKQKDSTVLAGTINLNGYISVRTTALAEECVVAKMALLVEEAQNKKSRTQRFIDKCAKFYTPAILVAAVGLAVVPLSLGVHNKDHWFHLALVVLVSSCPCALVLSTPVATFCALTKAAKSGVLIKGGDYLETLARTKTVAFDKTGTITKGEFVVVDFQSLSGDISLETLLYWVTSVESKSSHPLAAPVVQYGRSFGIEPKPEDVDDFQNFPGEGIFGNIDGQDVFIGNKRISAKAGCEIAPNFEGGVKGGKTMGYVFVGATLVGIFSLSDECRTGVVEAITKLKSMKIKTAMLTGDNQEAAMHAQHQINHALDLVHAELLPEDKSKIIEALKREGLTVMVGDGINDAPALATADIGISMGISGSALAVETGHVILMSNDVRKIPNVICLARRARRTVIVNVVLSIATKAAILALAFAGHPLIWAAVLADVGTCIVVILNSMLLLHERHRHVHGHGHKHGSKKCCSVPKKDKCCSKDVLSGQNHKHEKSNKKCCKSSSVPEDDKCCSKNVLAAGQNQKHSHMCNSANAELSTHRHHHSESPQLSCESRNCATKEQCAPPKKASCESRNCTSSSSSNGQCGQICHCSSQSGFSLCESKEFPNSSNIKQECCSSIDDECEAGGSSDNISSHLIDICNNNNIHGCSEGISSNQGEKHGGVLRENSQKISLVHASSCSSLEKRETGGCCKSYMRECCHGHLRHGLGVGGSLTEIITE